MGRGETNVPSAGAAVGCVGCVGKKKIQGFLVYVRVGVWLIKREAELYMIREMLRERAGYGRNISFLH